MKPLRSAAALLLAAVLLLPGGAFAAEEKYPDMPESYWAYAEMDKAVELGIINGMGGGYMAPQDTLTWGQYLVMLTRAFYPDDYAACSEAGAAWDQAGYQVALDKGILLEDDFLPVDPADLWAPILRQDVAVLLERMLIKKYPGRFSMASTFVDWDTLGEQYQDALRVLFFASIVMGREVPVDDPDWPEYRILREFGGQDTVMRSDGTVLLLRTLYEVDRQKETEVTVTLHIVDEQGASLLEDQVVEAKAGDYLFSLVDNDLVWHYVHLSDARRVSSFEKEYTLTYRPLTRMEIAERDFWDAVDRGEADYDDYYDQDFWLWVQGENDKKLQLLFGSADKRRFENATEASAFMTTVSIPVWHLDSNWNKVPASTYLTVHAAIADDVVALFTEIFNDPEQFPIHDIGGYAWRGDSATGEHNCGTAIDINAVENYQVRDGQTMAGSYWRPGTDPYSITPEGSVVRIFAEHGWSWGGDAWAWDSDPGTGYHDYMHFSYMGM